MCAYKVCGLKISHKSLQSEIAVGLSGQLIQEKVAGGPYTQNSCLMLKFSLIFFFLPYCAIVFSSKSSKCLRRQRALSLSKRCKCWVCFPREGSGGLSWVVAWPVLEDLQQRSLRSSSRPGSKLTPRCIVAVLLIDSFGVCKLKPLHVQHFQTLEQKNNLAQNQP